MGVPTLREVFEEKYYAEMEGGILEGLGRLFRGRVKLFILPTRETDSGELTTSDRLEVKPELNQLYRHLVDNGYIEGIREFDPADLQFTPGAVLAGIQSGDLGWEKLVPPQAAAMIKEKGLFGYRAAGA
jgi:hypothetical protein